MNNSGLPLAPRGLWHQKKKYHAGERGHSQAIKAPGVEQPAYSSKLFGGFPTGTFSGTHYFDTSLPKQTGPTRRGGELVEGPFLQRACSPRSFPKMKQGQRVCSSEIGQLGNFGASNREARFFSPDPNLTPRVLELRSFWEDVFSAEHKVETVSGQSTQDVRFDPPSFDMWDKAFTGRKTISCFT